MIAGLFGVCFAWCDGCIVCLPELFFECSLRSVLFDPKAYGNVIVIVLTPPISIQERPSLLN